MNPKALAHLDTLSPFQRAAAQSSPILMGLAADLRGGGGNAQAAFQHMQKQQEAAARKESIGSLMGQMGIAGPKRALLDALPTEAAMQMLAQQAFAPPPGPDYSRYKVVGGQLVDLGADGGPSVVVSETPDPSWRVMTPEEVAAVPNLDPAGTYLSHPKNGIKAVGGGGVQVHNYAEPKVPSGYQPVRDENGVLVAVEPIPGGPEDHAGKEESKKESEKLSANIVFEDIGRAIDMVEKDGLLVGNVTGFGAGKLSEIGGTAAADFKQLTATIRGNIGFDRLQRMRDESPTGGALGQVSNQEMATLQAVMGSLEQSQSKEQLLHNLRRLEKVYGGIIEKLGAYPNAQDFGFRANKPAVEMQVPEDLSALSDDEFWKLHDGLVKAGKLPAMERGQ